MIYFLFWCLFSCQLCECLRLIVHKHQILKVRGGEHSNQGREGCQIILEWRCAEVLAKFLVHVCVCSKQTNQGREDTSASTNDTKRGCSCMCKCIVIFLCMYDIMYNLLYIRISPCIPIVNPHINKDAN